MTVHTLARKQVVPAGIAEVFGFFSRPENLAKLTPPGLGFVILTPPPIEMKEGTLIDYSIRVFGVRVGWTTHITAFDAGRSFVDEQLRGPYAAWRHEHAFAEVPGGTEVSDEVRYSLPFGPLGDLVHVVAVRRQLDGIFDFRAGAVAGLFGKGTSKP